MNKDTKSCHFVLFGKNGSPCMFFFNFLFFFFNIQKKKCFYLRVVDAAFRGLRAIRQLCADAGLAPLSPRSPAIAPFTVVPALRLYSRAGFTPWPPTPLHPFCPSPHAGLFPFSIWNCHSPEVHVALWFLEVPSGHQVLLVPSCAKLMLGLSRDGVYVLWGADVCNSFVTRRQYRAQLPRYVF